MSDAINKIDFVGAGSGAVDLITLRGKTKIEEADVIVYAGSLVNKELLSFAKEGCIIHNSATMTLEEVMEVMVNAYTNGLKVVRLHTGDPSIYGAIREQMDILDEKNIPYEVCPGVSACFGAAASLNLEYTLPGVSQTLIITRCEGKTKVPEKEGIVNLSSHNASMAIYLSSGLLEKLESELLEGGYSKNTPAAIVYKATWPEEKKICCTVGTLAKTGAMNGIKDTALILVGDVINKSDYERSRLYAKDFSTGYRKAVEE